MPDRRPSSVLAVAFCLVLIVSLALSLYALFSVQQAGPAKPAAEAAEGALTLEIVKQELQKATAPLGDNLQRVTAQLGELKQSYQNISAASDQAKLKGGDEAAERLADQLRTAGIRIQKLEADLADLLKRQEEMARASAAATAGTPAAKAEAPEASPKQPSAGSSDAAYDDYCKADDKALDCLKRWEFGKAIQVFDAFLAKHPGSTYEQRANDKKRKYETLATESYGDVVAQAGKYAQDAEFDLAVQVYEKVADFGMPDLMRKAQLEIQKIKSLKANRSKESIKIIGPETAGADSTPVRRPRTPTEPEALREMTTGGPLIRERPSPGVPETNTMTVTQLLDVLEDKESPIPRRREAVRELAGKGDPKVVAALVGALKDPDWGVQIDAVRALAKTGNVKVADDVIELLDHRIKAVSNAASDTLKQLTQADLEDTSSDGWRKWWDENRARFGVPSREKVEPATTPAIVPEVVRTGAKSEGRGKVLVVEPAKNTVTFSSTGINPAPKNGEIFNVTRGNQWIAKIEIVHVAASLALAKGVIADSAPGETIKLDDAVSR
jgi:TolA-binding protein